VHVEKEFRRKESSAGTTQRSPVSLSARLARTATPGRAASTHPYDVSECTGHSSKPLESRRFPSCHASDHLARAAVTHRAGAVNEPGGVCALVDSLTDPPPRLDRSDVCGVDPGASARARPPHALEPEGDTPRATSPLAQRPPGRSPSWSSTRRFRENVADKISLVFSPHPASSLNS
jgi:hypothetical protein